MEHTPLTLVLLGKAGAGKGTQADLLRAKTNIRIISSGDMLREFAVMHYPASARLKETIDHGKLAPTWLISYLWIYKIMHEDAAVDLLFDGTPRMLKEAELLDEVLEWNGRAKASVFLIDIRNEVARERLMGRRMCDTCKKIFLADAPEVAAGKCPCGGTLTRRKDDIPEAIENRLAYYTTDVQPVVDYYERKGLLYHINGEQTPERVHEDVMRIVSALSRNP